MNHYFQLQDHAHRQPDQIAVAHRHQGGDYVLTSYKILAGLAREFAQAFADRLPANGIVPIYANKSVEVIAAMLGALGAHRAVACLNRKLRGPQIESALQASAAQVALVDGPGLMVLRDAPVQSQIFNVEWWVLRNPGFTAVHEKAAKKLAERASVSYWPDDFKGSIDNRLPDWTEDLTRTGCCLFTSGSTGQPKGVLISEHDLIHRSAAEAACFELADHDVLLSVLPFSFDVGLNQLLSSVTAGSELVLLDSWLPADILAAAEARRVTGISCVPSIWQDMIQSEMGFETSGRHSTLRYVTISGGDLSPMYHEKMPQLLPGVGIFKTYGQTEAFRATCLLPHEYQDRSESVGRPFPGVRIYAVREDDTLCEPGEIGQIIHSGLGVMHGYLGDQDASHKLRTNPFYGPGDPWPTAIFTGDHGHIDEQGYLYLQGRRDQMLKVAGNRVYPEEIAHQLTAIEGIGMAEVVGVKDSQNNTILVAFVVPDTGQSFEELAIRRLANQHLPSYMVPHRVVSLRALPRTESGKIDRPMLTQQATQIVLEDSSQ